MKKLIIALLLALMLTACATTRCVCPEESLDPSLTLLSTLVLRPDGTFLIIYDGKGNCVEGYLISMETGEPIDKVPCAMFKRSK
jgi:hypothetical protein